MLAALGQLTVASSYDDVAQVIIGEAVRRGYDPVPPLATAIQESSLRPDAVSANGLWKNIYQQDASYPGRDNPNTAISGFFDRLDAKRLTDGWNVDLWLNIFWLQQRPGEPSAADAYANGRQAYLAEIKSRTAEASRLVALYAKDADVPMFAPIFDYGVTKVMHGYNVDTCAACTGNSNGPRTRTLYVVIHTQEGDGTAVSLANYLNGTRGAKGVSYNFTVDDGDTVEVVPVGEAPWAAVEANGIGVHLCFAGSRVKWSTAEWLSHGAALDRAAKVVAAACLQYDIPPVKVLSTNGWPVTPKGIAGHADFGQRGGGHTDPEPNFPWENFIGRVKNQIAMMTGDAGEIIPPTPPETGAPADPAYEIMAQVRGRWEMLGWQTLVEVLAELRDASLGTEDADKKGFRW